MSGVSRRAIDGILQHRIYAQRLMIGGAQLSAAQPSSNGMKTIWKHFHGGCGHSINDNPFVVVAAAATAALIESKVVVSSGGGGGGTELCCCC